MENENQHVLTILQVRVLACLMEKHLATPKNYPLTPNSLTLACNQKTNREPVMNLTEGQVMHAVNELSDKRFVTIDYGSRTNKISHRAPGQFDIDRKQQAILAMLMLREPLTLNDIKARTERMVQFESIEEIQENIEELMTRSNALLIEIPKGSGRREERYTHLLLGQPDINEVVEKTSKQSSQSVKSDKVSELEQRIEKLEQQMQELLN